MCLSETVEEWNIGIDGGLRHFRSKILNGKFTIGCLIVMKLFVCLLIYYFVYLFFFLGGGGVWFCFFLWRGFDAFGPTKRQSVGLIIHSFIHSFVSFEFFLFTSIIGELKAGVVEDGAKNRRSRNGPK